MKNLNKFLAASIVLAFITSTTLAQEATTTATAAATIVAPITITKTVDFNFGRLSSNSGGTATLSATGIVTPGTGVAVVAGGTSTAASFDVTGEGTNLYTIVFPATVSLIGVPSSTMSIGTFTTASATLVGTLVAGAQTFTAGATLTIGAAQEPGVYTSANFDVTVSYN